MSTDENAKSFLTKFKLLSESSHLAAAVDDPLQTIFCAWQWLSERQTFREVHWVFWEIKDKTFQRAMATQSSNEGETYKREYRRIKSLVSSAYVRQTSVSFPPMLALPIKLWRVAETCSANKRHMCADCYVVYVIYSIYSHPVFLRNWKRWKFEFLMQHIFTMGSAEQETV